ncbi:hypothetical protein HELRODRAFT_160089 [Helobdella robusta]|uniref:Uncharacterized protein n=1 Tax=Helobdella robusta TaxID=6412 RepID=T1EPR7_HELRO|nr:hypothetical protein HELRODRAFT_160089 [Helobdella robusta]ESO05985.1 hypothetical protein HELRODRAFT_160089 [Helobdella robusta]
MYIMPLLQPADGFQTVRQCRVAQLEDNKNVFVMKRQRENTDGSSKANKAANVFKKAWLKEIVKTGTVDSKVLKNVQLKNIFDFSEDVDGASVMLGKRNRVAALIRAEVPHLTEQHCVAHRDDLVNEV